MRIDQANLSTIASLCRRVATPVAEAECLEDAAQALARALHLEFEESVVMARVFVTVPFGDLPATNRQFVERLVRNAGSRSELKPDTPILSLVGTHGHEADWTDRRKSNGHVGIPLISAAFVAEIPMISRLLKELGVPLKWIDTHSRDVVVNTVGDNAGLFFVDDAGRATDQRGRKIIAAQDFVSRHSVRTVFGTGGAYPNGQLIAIVMFCRDQFAKSVAEQFLAITDFFKDQTDALAAPLRVFAGSRSGHAGR